MKNYIVLALSFLIFSCASLPKYSFGEGEIPGQTFSIESFTNVASLINPNLAIFIQNSLQEKFANESNLKFIQGTGDAVFKGVITRYSITPVQGTGDETVALNRLTIDIKATYLNSVNDSQNFEEIISYADDFESTKDFSSIEEELMKSISKKIIDEIYQKTMSEW
tara:strand:- start:1097 stop:1594 length:498 start_codon:yes stop_codon:yes gene_type:complete